MRHFLWTGETKTQISINCLKSFYMWLDFEIKTTVSHFTENRYDHICTCSLYLFDCLDKFIRKLLFIFFLYVLALWCTCIRNKKWNNDECKIFFKINIKWFFMLFLFLHHNVNFFNYEIKNKLTNVRCFCKIIYRWKLFLITFNKFYFFNCQLQ